MRKIFIIPFLSLCTIFSCSKIEDNLIAPSSLDKWEFVTQVNSDLVDDLITTLYTDVHMNIWIGTSNGLSKYDGSTFTNYTQTGGQLTGAKVNAVIVDRDENVIVGTNNGLSFFDGTNWLFFNLFVGIEVTALVEAENGDVWVGTDGYGLVQLFYDGGFVQHVDNVCSNCNIIQSLFKDVDGTLWIGSAAGLKSYDGAFQIQSEFDGLWVTTISVDRWGNKWFGFFNEPILARFVDNSFELIPLVEYDDLNWARAGYSHYIRREWRIVGRY
jgi:ligand-binding sensor domain-containing protein